MTDPAIKTAMANSSASTSTDIRTVSIAYDFFGYADASALFELGDTKILCSVTLQPGVPPFLRGKNEGWLTAEYAMLPCSGNRRHKRDGTNGSKNGRSVEISRLIGRSLRSVCNLAELGERTIIIDCDVLQADGGTRVASITAASLVLQLAQSRWIAAGLISKVILTEQIAAISVGLVDGAVMLDPNYSDDCRADADFNFVMTRSGLVIEVQGTAEKRPLDWKTFDQLKEVAQQGIASLFAQADTFEPMQNGTTLGQLSSTSSPFALGKRLQ